MALPLPSRPTACVSAARALLRASSRHSRSRTVPACTQLRHNHSSTSSPSSASASASTSSSSSAASSSSSSVSSAELKHFASLASTWWDPQGPSRILHLMNPLRHDFIASCLAGSHAQQPPQEQEQRGLKYLDVGCGGGIFAESLARTIPSASTTSTSLPQTQTRASSLVAIDPSPTMIELALSHARKDPALHAHLEAGRFRYENVSLEDLASSTSTSTSTSPSSKDGMFDIVTIFEVLEHVDPTTSSPRAFLAQCLDLVRPGGWVVGSTIARTWPSFMINNVIAEAPWPIGVVPPGTHEWAKFVNADEIRMWAEEALVRESYAGENVSKAYPGLGWRCEGAMYFPGLGWKFVPGAEKWGNYFWGIQKLE